VEDQFNALATKTNGFLDELVQYTPPTQQGIEVNRISYFAVQLATEVNAAADIAGEQSSVFAGLPLGAVEEVSESINNFAGAFTVCPPPPLFFFFFFF